MRAIVSAQSSNSAPTARTKAAFVDTPDGMQRWFIHFQDMGTRKIAAGCITHLALMVWRDDWLACHGQ